MNSMQHAFCQARAKRQAQTQAAFDADDDAELLAQCAIHDIVRGNPHHRDFPVSKQPRPVSVHPTEGKSRKRFGQNA